MDQKLSTSSTRIKFETVGYAIFAPLALAWLWNSKFVTGSNAGEAVGYDLVSIGLPLVLLFAVSRNFLKNYKLWKNKSGIGILLFLLSAAALLCRGWVVAIFLALIGIGFVLGARHRQSAIIARD